MKSAVKAVKRLDGSATSRISTGRIPDANQERLFFTLVRECLEKGVFDVDLVQREMAANHVRHDALDLCQRLAA